LFPAGSFGVDPFLALLLGKSREGDSQNQDDKNMLPAHKSMASGHGAVEQSPFPGVIRLYEHTGKTVREFGGPAFIVGNDH
jgi:hypothetical protein